MSAEACSGAVHKAPDEGGSCPCGRVTKVLHHPLSDEREAGARRLAWFSDDELVAEVIRRGAAAHNHTRWRNNDGPWSPCPATCPIGRRR